MSGFQIFCGISGLVGAVANVLVIVISKIKKDSGNQDVQSTFLHICGSSILICLCMTATMSQEIRYDTAVIKIPHGFLAKSSPNFLTGIYAIQTSSYTYILFNISIMFLNRLNVICNKNTMSTIFSSKNMKIFTALAVIISLIQAAFVVLTAVDTNFLWERLNKTTTAIDDLFEKQEMSASFLQNQQIQIANQKQIDADMGIVPVANSNTTTNFKEQNRNQAFTEIILRQKPVEPKKEEMNEVDVEESKNMTTSQMRGMIKQGQEASTIAMPQ
uniref:7TM_GPCR_Srx domain-containing protein n=1 Tax=Rhabditophanes sp. KR3021 TaxID=114890 RepID=A0AC35UD67_9BILA